MLIATPAISWRFSNWSGAYSGSSDCYITMNADKIATAVKTNHSQLTSQQKSPTQAGTDRIRTFLTCAFRAIMSIAPIA
mgnify:CR=1 FL=1